MKKIIKWLLALFLIAFALVVGYIMTGESQSVNLQATHSGAFNSISEVEQWVAEEGLRYPSLKDAARSELIFADSAKTKTPYALVYIHGFSASKDEGNPVHRTIAKDFGMNAFFCRLPGHGLDSDDAFIGLTADQMLAEAKRAIEIGQLLGEKVVVMATSTGATLALTQAANGMPIEALILYAPLIDFFDERMDVFGMPRGIEIARQIVGGDYMDFGSSDNPQVNAIWYTKYHIEGLRALSALVRSSMHTDTFSKVDEPVFLGYYYKNEEEQDQTVSVEAMLQMYEQLSTPDSLKQAVAYPNAGAHVICSDLKSQSVLNVLDDTRKFLQRIVRN